MYLWVIDEIPCNYYDENGNVIRYAHRFVINGDKIEKPELPVYNGMFTSCYITDKDIQLVINGIKALEHERDFALKIGKISDNNILNNIKNGNSDGFSRLEAYAKNNVAIFEGRLTTNYNNQGEMMYNSTENTIDLSGKLEDDEYYYIYVIFDDENGKYAPIEHCLTFSQASISEEDGHWYLFPYGNDKFNWKEFSTENTGGDYTPTGTDGVISTGKDGTTQTTDKSTSTTILPHTGISYSLIVAISIFGVIGIIAYFKNNKYKGI